MVLVIGFLLLISLVLTAVTAAVTCWPGDALPIPGFVFQLLSLIISLAVATLP